MRELAHRVRPGGRLRVGRILGLGFRVWFRRFVPIHLVTVVCLAPLMLGAAAKDPFENGTIPGLFGLHSAAWVLAIDAMMPEGLFRNVAIGYGAQFAVTVILVREAHRRLAGRPTKSRSRAILGLLPLSAGALLAFALLDLLVTMTTRSHGPHVWLILMIAMSIAQVLLAAAFWLALPAAAIDGHGPFSALGRGRRLSRGARFPLAVVVIALTLLEWGFALILGTAMEPEHEAALAAIALLSITFKACVLAAAYRELCLLREGPPPDELGAIFS